VPIKYLNFLKIFIELLDDFGRAPEEQALDVPFKPLRNFSPVSTMPDSETVTVLECFIDVDDTAEQFPYQCK
jgi:hypothetical protein